MIGWENSKRIRPFGKGLFLLVFTWTIGTIWVGMTAFQKKSTDEFLKIKNTDKSIIFVSHNLEQVKQFCDRVILLEKGKIMKMGKPDEVIEEYISLMSKN